MKGKITFKGGAGSGNFGHSGRPGHVGGSGGGVGSGKGSSIPAGGKATLPSKGMYMQFDDVPGYHRLSGDDDAAFIAVVRRVERAMGKKIPTDPRTDFPTFTYYEDGEEMGGG